METNLKQSFIRKYYIYLLSFILPVIIMLIIFILREIYPFGDESFLHIDMYHQYFPFLTEMYHKLKSGDSLLYSWNTGIGSNFIALFAYYLAAPTNWLSVFFPEEYLIEFMSYMVILKIGFCGFTFAYYLRKHFQTKNFAIVFFALFYALSGYIAAYNWNVMWMDGLILAPLIILGLEQLVSEGRYKLYCITLAVAILSNFYLSIMICIYLVLYFLVLLASAPNVKRAFRQFFIYSLLAGGMAAVMLLPEISALKFTEFTNSNFPSKLNSYFSVIDVLARHSINVAVEIGLDHWPNIYCGVAVLFLLPLYILDKKIPSKEKIGKLSLFAFLLISFTTNILNFIWHGFNYPNSLPCRQSFLYIILLLTLCFEAFIHLREYTKVEMTQSFCFVLFFIMLCEDLVTDDAFPTGVFLITAMLLAFYAVMVYLYRQHPGYARKIAFITCLILIMEAGSNMFSTSVPTVNRSNYLENFDSYKKLARDIRTADTDFYRIDKFTRLTQNDAMLIGYPSATLFSSTSNGLVKNFYETYGLRSSKVFYSFEGATPLTSALLSVKYMFSKTERTDSDLYSLVAQDNGIYLYRNNYYLPLGYVIGSELLTDEALEEDEDALFDTTEDIEEVLSPDAPEEGGNPLILQNELAAKLNMPTPVFEHIPSYPQSTQTVINVEKDSYIYAYVNNKKVSTVYSYKNGERTTFKKLTNKYILDLGWQEAGTTLYLEAEGVDSLNVSAYRLNQSALQRLINSLCKQPLTVESYSSTHIKGSINVTSPGQLVLSIPYEPGWTLKVDGAETEVDSFESTFISTSLEEGEHSIELSYYPKGLNSGILVSLLCLFIFVITSWYLPRKKQFKQIHEPSCGEE